MTDEPPHRPTLLAAIEALGDEPDNAMARGTLLMMLPAITHCNPIGDQRDAGMIEGGET